MRKTLSTTSLVLAIMLSSACVYNKAAQKQAEPVNQQDAFKAREMKETVDYTMGSLELADPASNQKRTAMVSVSYATDRDTVSNAKGSKEYGSLRNPSNALEYGKAVVSIPVDHTFGELERPIFWFLENAEKHFVILSVSSTSYEAFERTLKNSTNEDCLVYIHGLNNDFKEGILRSAQLKVDLQFPGEVVLYSWPVKKNYIEAGENINWTLPHLREFLLNLTKIRKKKNIYIIAHSMGTKALGETLLSLSQKNFSKFKSIVLAAPDIDSDIFKHQIAPAMKTYTENLTMYASKDDLALETSSEVNRYSRAGFTEGGITVVDGVETIDASPLKESFLSLGHSYFANDDKVLNDLKEKITNKKPPEKRLLTKRNQKGLVFWEIKP